jgi:hypothetical protein
VKVTLLFLKLVTLLVIKPDIVIDAKKNTDQVDGSMPVE